MYSASIVLTCGEGISFRATETKNYITGLTDSIIDPDLVSIWPSRLPLDLKRGLIFDQRILEWTISGIQLNH